MKLSHIVILNNIIKYNNKIPKILLAKAFENDLPEELLSRKKKGFSVPYGKWMSGILDEIDIGNTYKEKFKRKEIGWTRYMSTLMLNKFNHNLDLCI